MIAPFDYIVFALVALVGAMISWHVLDSIGTRFMVRLVPVIVLSLVTVGGSILVERADQRTRSDLQARLSSLAPTYAGEMAALGHARISSHPDSADPRYLELIAAERRWLAASPRVADIYTIRRDTTGTYVLVVNSKTNHDRNGRTDAVNRGIDPLAGRTLTSGVGTFAPVPVRDRWGTWISAYEPILDLAGRPEAILGVDFAAGNWFAAITKARLAVLGYLTLLVLVVLGGVGLAVSQQRQHEIVRQAEARTAAISATSPVGLYTTSVEGQVTYVNEAYSRMMGRAPEALLGRGWVSATPPEDRDLLLAALNEAVEQRTTFDRVVRIVGDGEPRWLQVRSHPMSPNSALAGRVGSVEDITDHRRAQEALSAAATRLRAIFDATAGGIVVADAGGAIEAMNPVAHRMFGYQADELLGQSIGIVLTGFLPEQPADALTRLAAESQDGIARIRESVARHRDRSIIPIELAVSSVEIGGGITYIATISDIGERKRAEEERLGYLAELEAAKTSVEGATRAKSDFLATMSHEIRTPMNGVIGMVGLLLDTSLDAEQREYATTVKSSAESLLTIINDILDFSKVEAGRLTFEPLPFDLRVAVEESIDLLAARAAEKGLRLAARFAPGTPRRVIGDVGRVRQVLLNFAGNAIKFTGDGHVLLEISCDETTDSSAMIRLAVSDTGIGIPVEHQGRLFKKFSQADATTTRKFGGTGLGLAISKQLAELMGGEVGLSSVLGQGSTFWATVRLEIDRATAEVPAHPGLRDRMIVYVDGNPMQRLIMAELLAEWGTRSQVVDSGERALGLLERARAANEKVDLVVIDHLATTHTASELASAIRSAAGAPILALLTTGGTGSKADELASAGFSGYFARPLRSDTFADGLERLVATRCELPEPKARIPAAGPAADVPPPITQRRVLLVDDNVVNQKVASKVLEKMGCRVDVAANGREAVDSWSRMPYDLIFMDCQMPEMDGYEATGAIRRQEPAGSRVPVVALTANAMQGDRERCLEAGMDDYLSKPIKPDALRGMLTKWGAGQAAASIIRP